MKNFKINHKNWYLVLVSALLLANALLYAFSVYSQILVLPLLLTPVLIGLYRLRKSYLKSDDTKIYYNNGFLDLEIDIQTITSIDVKDDFLGFISRSLMLNYKQYEEIRVNPKDKQEFIKYLLEINPNITIEKLD